MRILLDPGNYRPIAKNLGCLAVLQVASARLRRAFPEARIQALTMDSDALVRSCPTIEPLPIDLGWDWYRDAATLTRVAPAIPESVRARLPVGLKAMMREHLPRPLHSLRRRWPETAATLLRLGMRLRGQESEGFARFLEAFRSADLVVVSGLGGLRPSERHVLATLEAAIGAGRPTAMLGLGLSGEHAPELLARMRRTLPRVNMLAVREGRTGPALLESLGVPPDRVVVTGDDAVELAYNARPAVLGGGLGINLRVMESAGVDRSAIERLRPLIQGFAQTRGAKLVGLPSANGIANPDSRTIAELFMGYTGDGDAGSQLRMPIDVIQQTGQCRVVITGAYHVAVFALSQGISTIALSSSEYFTDKLQGLADTFEGRCQMVPLDASDFESRLSAALDRAWSSADAERAGLLAAADRQVSAGTAAVERLVALVSERPRPAAGFTRDGRKVAHRAQANGLPS
jgi:colanic acid/amylovoran biosynthesis protein